MRNMFVFVVLLFPGTSFAQDSDPDSSRNIIYKQRTEIDFEGVEISGELVKPQGGLIVERRAGQFNPLIRLREDFNREINMSVDAIR